jgi:hypothetical protein
MCEGLCEGLQTQYPTTAISYPPLYLQFFHDYKLYLKMTILCATCTMLHQEDWMDSNNNTQ